MAGSDEEEAEVVGANNEELSKPLLVLVADDDMDEKKDAAVAAAEDKVEATTAATAEVLPSEEENQDLNLLAAAAAEGNSSVERKEIQDDEPPGDDHAEDKVEATAAATAEVLPTEEENQDLDLLAAAAAEGSSSVERKEIQDEPPGDDHPEDKVEAAAAATEEEHQDPNLLAAAAKGNSSVERKEIPNDEPPGDDDHAEVVDDDNDNEEGVVAKDDGRKDLLAQQQPPLLEDDDAEVDPKPEEETKSDDDENDDGGEDDSMVNQKEDQSDNDSDSDDSSEDESDDEAEENDGLSDYERLRLERIKRNEAKLAQLGLEGKDGKGVLGKKKKRQRRKSTEIPSGPRRSSLSRSTKKEIDYNAKIDLRLLKQPSALNKEKKDAKPRPKGRPPKQRVPQFIYYEFKRIKSKRRKNLKGSKRNLKTAKREVNYWNKQTEMQRINEHRAAELERILKQQEEERRLLGSTKLKLLEEIDRRTPELTKVLYQYNLELATTQRKELERQQMEAEQKRKQELDRKMRMIDALDRFPKAMKDAIGSLNSMLYHRSPRDPPPPRRSKRKSDDIEETPSKKKKAKAATHEPVDDSSERQPKWSKLASALEQPSSSPARTPIANEASASGSAAASPATTENKPRRKKEITGKNVGGWISPHFSKELDRSWLERQKPAKTFDLSTYVPQVGDTVLYYPSAHKQFLAKYPDTLGVKMRNVMRVPLWQRATRESSKMQRSTDGTSPKPWWTDEWIGGIQSDMGNYPLVCRVERTHAEFPPDPYSGFKVIRKNGSETTVTWAPPAEKLKTKKKNQSPRIRLAISLRPLTPVVPPRWTEMGPQPNDSISLPPNFTVVTFPAAVDPYLVPFSWAYCLTHSLSIGDTISIRNSEKSKSKVTEFRTLGGDFGSFRLEDKINFIQSVLGNLNSGQSMQVALAKLLSEESNGRSGSSSFPVGDACIVAEFLNKYMEQRASKQSQKSSSAEGGLIDLIRSTLPLFNGVGVIRDVFHRQTRFASRWNLSARNKPGDEGSLVVQGLQEAFPHELENALREKIVYTINDFIQNKQGAEFFVPLVTDDAAPGYYTAVPVGVHFGRILSRLKCKNSKCYYTSVDSVLSDVQAIADNCVLYNSPESHLVELCLDLIPAIKRLVSDIYTQHVRERSNRIKAEEERRRFVLRTCDTSALQEDSTEKKDTAGRRKKGPTVPDDLNTPFKAPIHRDWLERTNADGSWPCGSNIPSLDGKDQPDLSHWIPQSGDTVLYSRSLHSDFVKGHYHELAKRQCILPQFQATEGASSPAAHKEPMEEIVTQDSTSRAELSEKVKTHWLMGTVVGVRSSFPRAPGDEDSEESTFEPSTPVLVLGLRFPYAWSKGEVHVVCWRPCQFAADLGSTETGEAAVTPPESNQCQSCRLSRVSFLRPAWISQESTRESNEELILPFEMLDSESSLRNDPRGMDETALSSISRCFNLLKRRCLGDVEPDYVDPKFCLENAQRGSLPVTASMGSRSLPSFEDFLVPASNHRTKKTMHTRGIRKTDDGEAMEKLARVHFLPPWSSKATSGKESKGQKVIPDYETIMPFPTLCLELIHLRMKNGYYRQSAAVVNDIYEAYVTSVLYLLSGPATRKKNRISIRKIAKRLYSAKGNTRVTKLLLPQDGKKKPKANVTVTLSTTSPAEEADTGFEGFTDEEVELITRIDIIRRLHATAIVCITETRHVERIFGITLRKESKDPQQLIAHSIGPHEELKRRAIQRIQYLLTAIGRDPCQNRVKYYAQTKLRVLCDGQTISEERQVEEAATKPNCNALVSNNSSVVASKPEDCIKLSWPDVEKNEDLVRCIFGRPGRMFPCVRCQVYQVPLVTCRIRRFHSNPDFGFVENFKNFGGVDGLLNSVLLPQGDPNQNDGKDPRSESSEPTKGTTASTSNGGGDRDDKSDNRQEAAQGTANIPKQQTNNDGANESQPKTSLQSPTDQEAGENQKVPKEDPSEHLGKAKSALELASFLYQQAHLLADSPVRLGESFIKTNFPIDPEDGHFTYCIICGLSGNVLCCDGCSNVVHTQCIGLAKIPDEDWFCPKCVIDKGLPMQRTTSQAAGKGDADAVGGNEDKVGDISIPADAGKTAVSTNPSLGSGEEQNNEKANPSEARPGSEKASEPSVRLEIPRVAPAITDEGFDEKETTLEKLLGELVATRVPTPLLTTHSALTNTGATPERQQRPDTAKILGSKDAEALHEEGTDGAKDGAIDDNVSASDELSIPMGTVFVKTFQGLGDFPGKVVELPSDERPYYSVLYEDGDSEDLSPSELLVLLPSDVRQRYLKSGQNNGALTASMQPTSKRQLLSIEKRETLSTSQTEKLEQDTRTRRRRPPNRFTEEASKLYSTPKKTKAQTNSQSHDTSTARAPSATPPRKRGRPRKDANVSSDGNKNKKTKRQETNSVLSVGQPKLKRGRPTQKTSQPEEDEKASTSTAGTSRQRGRPRKRPASMADYDLGDAAKESVNTKKRSGKEERPGKRDSSVSASQSKRRRVEVEEKSRGRRSIRGEKSEEEEKEARPAINVLEEVQKLVEDDSPAPRRRGGRRRSRRRRP